MQLNSYKSDQGKNEHPFSPNRLLAVFPWPQIVTYRVAFVSSIDSLSLRTRFVTEISESDINFFARVGFYVLTGVVYEEFHLLGYNAV
jgi:hypothetical protein